MIYKITNQQRIATDAYHLLILLSGNLTIAYGDDQTLALSKRSWMLFDQNIEVITASPYLEGYAVELNRLFLGQFPQIKELITTQAPFFEVSKLKDFNTYQVLINSLLSTQHDSSLLQSYLHILVTKLLQDNQHAAEKTTVFQRFCELIDENIEQNYCAGQYAKILDIPLKQLIKEVKQTVNKTPCNVITERVIEKAKDKLVNTTDSSKMIAYQLGFEDPYYFIKYFKKNTSYTPTQFRTKYQ